MVYTGIKLGILLAWYELEWIQQLHGHLLVQVFTYKLVVNVGDGQPVNSKIWEGMWIYQNEYNKKHPKLAEKDLKKR